MARSRVNCLWAWVLVFILSALGGVSPASTQPDYVLYDDFEDGALNLHLWAHRVPYNEETGQVVLGTGQMPPPVASFKWLKVAEPGYQGERLMDEKHTVGAIIRFDPSESFSPMGEIIMYVWDFDNGITIITDSPNVYNMEFEEARVYNVRLTVTDDNGLTHAFEEAIDLSLSEI